jgi:hypothetical protein
MDSRGAERAGPRNRRDGTRPPPPPPRPADSGDDFDDDDLWQELFAMPEKGNG